MEPLQIIAIIFGAFFLLRVYFKHSEFEFKEMLFWSVVWLGLILVAIKPKIAGSASALFGVEKPLNFVVYVSIIALFYLIFRLYVSIHEMEQEITTLTREIAKEKKK